MKKSILANVIATVIGGIILFVIIDLFVRPFFFHPEIDEKLPLVTPSDNNDKSDSIKILKKPSGQNETASSTSSGEKSSFYKGNASETSISPIETKAIPDRTPAIGKETASFNRKEAEESAYLAAKGICFFDQTIERSRAIELAKAGALAHAQANLLALINGIYLKSETKVDNFEKPNTSVIIEVEGLLRFAEEYGEPTIDDKKVEVKVRIHKNKLSEQ